MILSYIEARYLLILFSFRYIISLNQFKCLHFNNSKTWKNIDTSVNFCPRTNDKCRDIDLLFIDKR